MSTRRVFAALLGSLLLTACGGGGDNDHNLSREYGLLLQVDGSTTISDKVLTQQTLTRENYNQGFEVCVENRIRSDGTTVQVPVYDNFEEIENSDYCDGERLHVERALSLQARFINNTFEPLPISFRGVGIEIRIYAVDSEEAPDGEEVWNSIIAQDLGVRLAGQDPFDPDAEQSLVLGPGQAYPSQSQFALGYTFNGDRNYRAADPDNYNFEQDFAGLGWNSADPEASECTLRQTIGTTGWDAADPNRTRRYNKPLCQTESLPAGLYRVRIDYSFTPAVEPVMFHVRLDPEPQS